MRVNGTNQSVDFDYSLRVVGEIDKVYKMLQESVGDVQLVRPATDVDGLIVDVAVEEEPP